MSNALTLEQGVEAKAWGPPRSEAAYQPALPATGRDWSDLSSITISDPADEFDDIQLVVVDSQGNHLSGFIDEHIDTASRSRLEYEIDDVFRECRSENWDDYGARPVKQDTVTQAKRFLRKLPETNPSPSIGADPDGEINFEWYVDPDWVLTASIGETGWVSFAGSFGANRVRGSQPLGSGAAQRISGELKHLFRVA